MANAPVTQQDDIDFDKMSNAQDGMEELGLDDMGHNFLRNPKVGEELVVDISKVFKDNNVNAKTKEGRAFKTSLSGVDYKYTLETTDGKRYSPSSWEVWGAIRALMLANKTQRIMVKIKHVRDGNKVKDGNKNYEVTLLGVNGVMK